MIYSDGIHIVSDVGVADLHAFAAEMGIARGWFHARSRFPHYDVPFYERDTFFADYPEVQQVSSKEIVRILRRSGQVKERAST